MNYDVQILDVARCLVDRFGCNAAFLAGRCLELSIQAGDQRKVTLCQDMIRAIEAVSNGASVATN